MTSDLLILPPGSAAAGARLHLSCWLPRTIPRAIVLLAHGYAEHAGRYAHVARRFTDAGLAVYAVDHWGHGRSEGVPGFVPDFKVFVDGMAALLARVRAEHPDAPRLLLGHSMGGLVAVHLLLEAQDAFVAAALSGPAIVPAEPPSALTLWLSRLLARVAPRLGVVALDADAVSRSPAIVDAYKADPLVYTGKIGARLGKEMIEAMALARDDAPSITLPLFLQHGMADRLAAPEGSQYLFDHVGSCEKRLELYPGLYHEIYNEPERDELLDDLIGWFDRQLSADRLARSAQQTGA